MNVQGAHSHPSMIRPGIRTAIAVLILLIGIPHLGFPQVIGLHPWTEVYGTVPGERLGQFVAGFEPTANFPYRAAVSRNRTVELYTLDSPTDTSVKRIFEADYLTTGDLNGDPYVDVVTQLGSLFTIYWGTPDGIDSVNTTSFYTTGTQFYGGILIGDLLGDTIPELIIGDRYFNNIQGRVLIYEGGTLSTPIPSVVIHGDSDRYGLGLNLAIGDLNDDGWNDLSILGEYTYGQDSDRYNYVDVFFGSAQFDTTREFRLMGASRSARALSCFDANGDGTDDLLWTHRLMVGGTDRVSVYFGSPSFDDIEDLQLADPSIPNWGYAIINPGDMNGDGYDDVLVADPAASLIAGYVFVFSGGPLIDSLYDATVGMSSDSRFGFSVSGIGDIDSDGLSDIIVGGYLYELGDERGYWGIFRGDSTMRGTDVSNEGALPVRFHLYQCYPNPFNPITTIRYDLDESAIVRLEITNTLGESIATLVDERQAAGRHDIPFDATGHPSGVYFYTVSAKHHTGVFSHQTRRLVLIK